MSTRIGDENTSSTINGLPLGYYYYLIPNSQVSYATYLGYVDTIQSVTYNPFLEETDINDVVQCPFNTDKYGTPTGGAPNCYRIQSFDRIEKTLCNIDIFPTKDKYNSIYDPKLLIYPFTYYIVTDYINPPLLIKPEMIKGENKIKVKVKTTSISCESKYNIYVENYKGDVNGNLEGMNNTTSLMLPVTSSVYSQFIANSMSTFTQSNINALLENDKTLNQGLQSNALNYNINNAKNNIGLGSGIVGSLSSLLMGNIAGGIASGVSTGINYGMNKTINNLQTELSNSQLNENAQLSEYEVNSMAQARITDLLNTPNSIKTAGNDTLFNLINSNRKIDIIKYQPKPSVMRRLNEYFKRFGYRVNKYSYLAFYLNNRKNYNFVKTNYCNISAAKVPLIHIEKIKEIFNRGTTIWHIDNGAEPLDYNVDNMEV